MFAWRLNVMSWRFLHKSGMCPFEYENSQVKVSCVAWPVQLFSELIEQIPLRNGVLSEVGVVFLLFDWDHHEVIFHHEFF